ncbi:MIR domain protein [Ichthyophthirius multifiliis]|uniref:MIR domain protein n=1 Tax=Ichthyophthirius multifiliis TaxID=5932 RepID=G0QVT6_ICHMU|nr:MIR domain protein [Ichthyophthirius multifiliis]EGR30674.1 MIR domain protein [Ichthyophthirius multifiliis]|eukprot:XP_004032261.1 MIR domain protein [Ichthyophthirius multifiliis]
MLNLLLELNLFNILGRQKDYFLIVQYLIKLIAYDKINIIFSSTSYYQAYESSVERQNQKNKLMNMKINVNINLNKDMFNIFQENDEEISEQDESNLQYGILNSNQCKIDENLLYNNPLMRGFLKINSSLHSLGIDDNDKLNMDIKIKLQICDIFEQFLNMRQDYLIQNVMHWFSKNIIDRMNKEEIRDDQSLQQAFDEGFSKIFPNISKTGFQELDERYKPKDINQLNQILNYKQFFKNLRIEKDKQSKLNSFVFQSFTSNTQILYFYLQKIKKTNKMSFLIQIVYQVFLTVKLYNKKKRKRILRFLFYLIYCKLFFLSIILNLKRKYFQLFQDYLIKDKNLKIIQINYKLFLMMIEKNYIKFQKMKDIILQNVQKRPKFGLYNSLIIMIITKR